MPVSTKPRKVMSKQPMQKILAKDEAMINGLTKIFALLSRATKGKVRADTNSILRFTLAKGI